MIEESTPSEPQPVESAAQPLRFSLHDIPAGYKVPGDILKRWPKLSRVTLVHWYTFCPPLKRAVRTWPPNAGDNARRAVCEADIEEAARWYVNEFADRFTDSDLGELVSVDLAAKSLGVYRGTVLNWENSCPRLGPDRSNPGQYRKLELFQFYRWGFNHARQYTRQEDIDQIKESVGRAASKAGYKWPADILQRWPKLPYGTLRRWYTHCPPLDRPVKTLPDSPKPREQRSVLESDIEAAIRWYIDKLDDRFVDGELGPLLWIGNAAKEIGCKLHTVLRWKDGCPRLGPSDEDSRVNRKLELFGFYAWKVIRGRTYAREQDIANIKNFRADPVDQRSIPYADLLKKFDGNFVKISRFFDPGAKQRKRGPRGHLELGGRPGRAGFRRVKKTTSAGNVIVVRQASYDRQDADAIVDQKRVDRSIWKLTGELATEYPSHRSKAGTMQSIRQAGKAGRVDTKRIPVAGRPHPFIFYNLQQWQAERDRLKSPAKGDHSFNRGRFTYISRRAACDCVDVTTKGQRLEKLAAEHLSGAEFKSFSIRDKFHPIGGQSNPIFCRLDLVNKIAIALGREPVKPFAESLPATQTAKPSSVKRKSGERGKAKGNDAASDARLAAAWNGGDGAFKTKAQLADAQGMTEEAVKNALERHRKEGRKKVVSSK